jgi:hypothetical protein
VYSALDKSKREKVMPLLQYINIDGYIILYQLLEEEEGIDTIDV